MIALQVALPGIGGLLMVLMVLAFYGGIAFLLMKTYSYFFGNTSEIKDFRERVATLEHEVEDLRGESDDSSLERAPSTRQTTSKFLFHCGGFFGMLPLQIGLPGTQEFVIILLIFVLLAGIAVLVVVPVVLLLRWRSDDDETTERVAELEEEVERLRDQQGASRDDTRESGD